jgi:Dolichyl-phosphate-mannose-protein mannosyltransferase
MPRCGERSSKTADEQGFHRRSPLTLARSVAVPRAEARAAGLVGAVPVAVWLAALTAASALLRYALARRMVAPWIMVDELVYSELAKSFAATGHFAIRDAPSAPYGFVYPLLIAPAYRLFASVPAAYDAAKAINSVAMSLVTIPAYLLARRVLPVGLSLAAAAFAVAVPSMAYTGTLMTENAFYPVFVLFALALVRVLERPTRGRQLVLVALFGLAFVTRTQAVALVPAMLTAPLALAWVERGGRRALRPFVPLYAVTAVAAALIAAIQLARGRSLTALLGAYEAAGRQHYAPGAVAHWLVLHAGELDLYVGVVPLAAFLVLAGTVRGLPRAVRAFVVATAALSVWLVLEVAAAVPIPARVEERNMFYVAPLLVVALLVWIDRGLPRPQPVAPAAALVAATLPATLPLTKLIGTPTTSDTLVLVLFWRLHDHLLAGSALRLGAILAAAALALTFLLVPRRAWLVLPALVWGVFVAVEAAALDHVHGFRQASAGALFQGITAPHRDWIDRTLGRHARVAVIWSGLVDAHVIWENEFFNRSVGRVYFVGSPLPGGLPETRASFHRASGLLTQRGRRRVRTRYALADGSFEPVGRKLAADPRKGVALYRVFGPFRAAARIDGVYAGDTWSARHVRYLRRACAGGTLAVSLVSDGTLFPHGQRVAVTVNGRPAGRIAVARGGAASRTITLRPRGGRCVAGFAVSPTAVPGRRDRRVLGIHFQTFSYTPPR